jgi:hypothetical protein
MTQLVVNSGYGLTWPQEITGCSSFEPMTQANVKASTSQFDGSSQIIETPSARRTVRLSFNILAGEEANAMYALADNLRSGAKRVLVPWFARPVPLGTQRGAPTVNAAGSAGKTLALNNVTIGATFKRGDMWGLVTGQVVMIEEDATNYAASVILRLTVPLRKVPPNGSVAYWDRPRLVMRLADRGVTLPAMSGGQVRDVELNLIEDFV